MTIKNFNIFYVVAFIFLILLLTPPSSYAVIHNVDIVNFAFTPLKTTVAFGDTVRWTLQSGVHTTTSEVSSPKSWDSGTMTTIGQTYDVIFTIADGAGPFPYLCSVHPSTMKDTIFVDTCAHQTPGDANSDGSVEVGDLTYLISYLYSGGSAPDPLANGDPNGDCCIDTFDIVYLTDFLFVGGPPPVVCTCINPPVCVDTCAGQFPGDANSDGLIAVNDITFLIDFLYISGPPPNPLANGDPNGDCCIDTFDIVYLTDFLFVGGPPPVVCTCVNPPVCVDTCAGQMPGDVNGDGAIDTADLTMLLNYLVSGGVGTTGPNWDLDGDCYISGTDLTYLKLFLFAAGPAPVICTCVNPQYTDCYPGDADNSLELDVSDAVYLITYIFSGGFAPAPYATCSGDADCSGAVDVSDAVYIVALVFGGGPFPCTPGSWILQYGPPF